MTVVSPDSLPFKKILGEEIGKVFQQVHEENGVTFELGRKISEFQGDGKVERVILDNGDRLDADMVVVGIGDTQTAAICELMRLNKMPSPQVLRDSDLDLIKLLQQYKERGRGGELPVTNPRYKI